MKKFLLAVFLSVAVISVHAQWGIGFYPLNNMGAVRWNQKTLLRDSAHAHFETNYNFHLEARSTLTISHNSHGTTINALPEIGFFHRIAGIKNGPMLMTGAGAYLSVNRSSVNAAGIFFPLLLEYVPQLNFTHNLAFSFETDLLITANVSHSNARLVSLFSVAWIFSPPAGKAH